MTTNLIEFVTEKLKENRINENQADYIIGSLYEENKDITELLNDLGLYNEYLDYKPKKIIEKPVPEKPIVQEPLINKTLVKEQIDQKEKELIPLFEQIEHINISNAELNEKLLNGQKRLQQYPDNPRLIKEVEELELQLKPSRIQITSLSEQIDMIQLEISNLEHISNL
jgi:hypothetical protein